jgi:hypothetical protein
MTCLIAPHTYQINQWLDDPNYWWNDLTIFGKIESVCERALYLNKKEGYHWCDGTLISILGIIKEGEK